MKELNNLKKWLLQKKLSSSRNNQGAKQNKAYTVLLDADPRDKNSVIDSIQAETRRDVHRIDLSKLISKYIGETEKNLSAVFKEA